MVHTSCQPILYVALQETDRTEKIVLHQQLRVERIRPHLTGRFISIHSSILSYEIFRLLRN